MKVKRRLSLLLLLLSGAFSFFFGFTVARTASGAPDFRPAYYGARCMLQRHNPYKASELEGVYRADGLKFSSDPVQRQVEALNIYLPAAYILLAPFALLPYGTALVIWLILLAGVFLLAAFLVWDIGKDYAPGVTLFLICIVLANSEVIFAGGNPAGIAVSLCVVAVWCFLRKRFVPAGILCMAVSLAIKPHDAGLIWLFFLLAGGIYRKRALQTLAATLLLALPAMLWISHIAPHWIADWQSNMAIISARGGVIDPGPASRPGFRDLGMIIDLQTVISVFRDDPRIYNSVSYLVCGALLLAWSVTTLRSRLSQKGRWLALAAVVPLAMLVTYHRPYDAKLLLLTIPACALLWAEGGPIRWIALPVNTAALLLTGDIPLTILLILTRNLHLSASSLSGQIVTVVLARPVPFALLCLGIFYLWVYLRLPSRNNEGFLQPGCQTASYSRSTER
jgi:hypothetical protein